MACLLCKRSAPVMLRCHLGPTVHLQDICTPCRTKTLGSCHEAQAVQNIDGVASAVTPNFSVPDPYSMMRDRKIKHRSCRPAHKQDRRGVETSAVSISQQANCDAPGSALSIEHNGSFLIDIHQGSQVGATQASLHTGRRMT